jgi:catechol 2,3-dioxygenase-like lactoylglutathione lyase family enzyme
VIEALDHINLRTARLEEMVEWYGRILQMPPGPRPDFGFPGAWLYAGGHALVHLVAVAEEPADAPDLKLEHGAFRARGIADLIARLDAAGERYRVSRVPGWPVVQVNVWDPDGNHLHIDFDLSEAEAAGLVSP